MRISLKMCVVVMIATSTMLLSECTGTPPDLAPAATGTFQQESYRSGLQHREQMIEQGRSFHVKKQKLVV